MKYNTSFPALTTPIRPSASAHTTVKALPTITLGSTEHLFTGYRGFRRRADYMTRQLKRALPTITSNEGNMYNQKKDTNSDTASHHENINEMDTESDVSAQNELIKNLIYNPSDKQYRARMRLYH
jgi:hypothetical protein